MHKITGPQGCNRFFDDVDERGACGVGFVANLMSERGHRVVEQGLEALARVEHRGACASDGRTGDGAGLMTDIPFELLGYTPGTVAIASLFVNADPIRRRIALQAFRTTFDFLGLEVLELRPVPVVQQILGPIAQASRPDIVQAIITRPRACRTDEAFDSALYHAKQLTFSRLKARGAFEDLTFTSLSMRTVVYKALTTASDLAVFYPDLRNPRFTSRFALFHRRFSTNTRTSWERAQPFRLVAHNGEINTIAGNRSWAYSREQAMGLQRDLLLTHDNTSDSGNLNQMVEALKYRSSMPHLEDILAIMIPPGDTSGGFYDFWGRAMEPWDGPAFVTYSDGTCVGARLDRNGFRPCRWLQTDDHFFLASEAGLFDVEPKMVRAKGTLNAGAGATVDLERGEVHFRDPSHSRENEFAVFEPRLVPLPDESTLQRPPEADLSRAALFGVTRDEVESLLVPTLAAGKEPIGSMGDTARLAVFSDEHRSLFDFLFQDFAQVTNPPLDYLRERLVTDLTTHLGKKPNIFAPKELIPPTPGFKLHSPLLGRSQTQFLKGLSSKKSSPVWLSSVVLDATFPRNNGPEGLENALNRIGEDALNAARSGASILIISDRAASVNQPPVPSVLALRTVVNALNRWGLRLETSIVVESGDVRSTHHFAALIGFGAAAVCPYLVFDLAEVIKHKKLNEVSVDTRKFNLRQAMESGLLKVMSKMGISVARSYQSSKLFTPVGLGDDVVDLFFPGRPSVLGGLSLYDLGQRVLACTDAAQAEVKWALPAMFRLKEHARGTQGEAHAMTARRARTVHQIVDPQTTHSDLESQYASYLEQGRSHAPYSFVDLLQPRTNRSMDKVNVEPAEAILARFGSGAMSFGALSAESQRDIFIAMKRVGGRSNSGEGGENPYYATQGITASTKQIASGRFGVTAEYLVTGNEIEIKMAQGAKPGEGGQLMGTKVDTHIAKARNASEGVDLISPPPLHDIYSIEDLKQLVYELRQLHPTVDVVVKLVSGANIGSIAAGAVKAGADVIQISGGSGGTGAAPLTSMMHAGLPWEVGLVEAHQALVAQGLREHVKLRVDGGIQTGRDVVIAALLGADEFGFGKLLLVAQGCIMARICEKNRCPRGIATQDPKFKAKYRGSPEAVETMLRQLAEEVREHLRAMGTATMAEVIGRTDLLTVSREDRDLAETHGLDLGYFRHGAYAVNALKTGSPFRGSPSVLNEHIVADARPALEGQGPVRLKYGVTSEDRAVLTSLAGTVGRWTAERRTARRQGGSTEELHLPEGEIQVSFEGAAGQGFAAFATRGLDISLAGEANDSVGKGMSGGRLIITPTPGVQYNPAENVIIGNCALYGATGGRVFVHGIVGDRFAVRNSGAQAVAEGAGLHLCEYMTQGMVVILGPVGPNVGAGMTGGALLLPRNQVEHLNSEYVASTPIDEEMEATIRELLEEYVKVSHSTRARAVLDHLEGISAALCLVQPLNAIDAGELETGRTPAVTLPPSELTSPPPAAPLTG